MPMCPPFAPTAAPRDALVRTLLSTRLFRDLDPALAATFASHAAVVHLERGERLWSHGTPAEYFHVILRGVLELRGRNASADTTLIALFGPGQSPAIPATLERRTFIADAHASTREVDVLRVRAAGVLAALPTNASLALAMSGALLEHCRLLHSKIDVLSAGTVPRRLAAFFLDLLERFGDEHEDGMHHAPLALSRHQIATYVDARVETVIRCCSAWQKAGILETSRDGFVISSPDRLRRILEGHDVVGQTAA